MKNATQRDRQIALQTCPTISAQVQFVEEGKSRGQGGACAVFLKVGDSNMWRLIGWLSDASSWFFREPSLN